MRKMSRRLYTFYTQLQNTNLMRRRSSYNGLRTRRKLPKRRLQPIARDTGYADAFIEHAHECEGSAPSTCAPQKSAASPPLIVNNHIHIESEFGARQHGHHHGNHGHPGYGGFNAWQPSGYAGVPPWGGGLPPWLMFGGSNAYIQPCLPQCPVRGWCGPSVDSVLSVAPSCTQQCAPVFSRPCA
uniref:Uncharacterized protein n=1 Tax=viral metagenome TaxID=1070528 RepID=A0A6C0C2L3_9ZZZZ